MLVTIQLRNFIFPSPIKNIRLEYTELKFHLIFCIGTIRGPKCKQEDNIKLVLKAIGYKDVDWIHMAQDRD
jgi:hypothetical protein